MTQSDRRGGEHLGDADPFAMWDAAYVLGSLDAEQRRQYEAHLSTCAECGEAGAELSGMPALLALLDPDEVAALDEASPELPPPPPELLDSLLAKVRWRDRRRRRLSWTKAGATAPGAAACDIAIGADHDPGGAKFDRRDGQSDQSGVGYPHRDELHLPEGVGGLRPAPQ